MSIEVSIYYFYHILLGEMIQVGSKQGKTQSSIPIEVPALHDPVLLQQKTVASLKQAFNQWYIYFHSGFAHYSWSNDFWHSKYPQFHSLIPSGKHSSPSLPHPSKIRATLISAKKKASTDLKSQLNRKSLIAKFRK